MYKKCNVDGCDGKSRTKGLCQMHYARLWRSGTVDEPKPYEQRTKHPMYITWMSAKRGKSLCDAWRDDFNLFLQEIAPVPEGNFRLFRKDVSQPYSKENVYWRQMAVDKAPDETSYEYHKRKQREKKKPELSSRRRAIKRIYGLTLEQYDEMLKTQGGGCAICGNPETRINGKTGKVKNLSVDHCHTTRNVRGILCGACNVGLGKFNDSPELMMRAIEYLQKHKRN